MARIFDTYIYNTDLTPEEALSEIDTVLKGLPYETFETEYGTGIVHGDKDLHTSFQDEDKGKRTVRASYNGDHELAEEVHKAVSGALDAETVDAIQVFGSEKLN